MRRIAAVTFARSDYSSLLPVLKRLQCDPEIELHVIVSGTHLAANFGKTVDQIEADGIPVSKRVDMLLASDSPQGIVKSIGVGVISFGQIFEVLSPDLLLMVGDRLELLAAASAALPFKIPIAHISGGDVTEGSIDNQVRYAVTQLSHLHFVSMQSHADRLIRLGTESWRITVSGDPALDTLRQMQKMSRNELAASLGLELTPPLALVSYHPTTLTHMSVEDEIGALIKALEQTPATFVVTSPNADAGHQIIVDKLGQFVARTPRAKLFTNLGQKNFYSLLALADVIIGNSSSGIWEAPSFGLPAVNVGDRQRGRTRAKNVIDVPPNAPQIVEAIGKALSKQFRAELGGMDNPYGDGMASERIIRKLKETELGLPLLRICVVEKASG